MNQKKLNAVVAVFGGPGKNNIIEALKHVKLCGDKVEYGPDGVFVPDDFMTTEYKRPTRYNFRRLTCSQIQDALLSDRTGLEAFYIGCVIKYLYRNLSVGDLEKAKTYLDMAIERRKHNEN